MITDRRKQALIEMAKRGTPEEQKIAESIIEKSGISIEDEQIIKAELSWKSSTEKTLLHQIISTVMNTSGQHFYTRKDKRKTIWIDATKSQKAEIDLFFSIYSRELESEIQLTLEAFVHRNNIFPLSGEAVDSKKSIEEQLKMLARMKTMDKTHIRKQISEGLL